MSKLWQYRRVKIDCRPNGPYLLHDAPPGSLRRADGSELKSAGGVALCRCGGSANKPYCDGTHRRNGFSGENQAEASREPRLAYAGAALTIFDDRSICAHAGFCTDRLKSVFRMGVEPWIDPDAASVDEIIATIEKCPSGALSYARGGLEASAPARAAAVTVTNDGPYAVTGGVELLAASFAEGASKEHYTLCRCGKSNNKPFCDGTHWSVGFKDP